MILSQFRFPLVSFCALVVRCFPHPIFLSVLPLCGPGLCGRADLPSELQHARRVWKEIQAQQVCSSLRSRHLLSGSYDPLLCLYVSSPPVVVSGGAFRGRCGGVRFLWSFASYLPGLGGLVSDRGENKPQRPGETSAKKPVLSALLCMNCTLLNPLPSIASLPLESQMSLCFPIQLHHEMIVN